MRTKLGHHTGVSYSSPPTRVNRDRVYHHRQPDTGLWTTLWTHRSPPPATPVTAKREGPSMDVRRPGLWTPGSRAARGARAPRRHPPRSGGTPCVGPSRERAGLEAGPGRAVDISTAPGRGPRRAGGSPPSALDGTTVPTAPPSDQTEGAEGTGGGQTTPSTRAVPEGIEGDGSRGSRGSRRAGSRGTWTSSRTVVEGVEDRRRGAHRRGTPGRSSRSELSD